MLNGQRINNDKSGLRFIISYSHYPRRSGYE